jgi:hypothetical protein
MKEGLKKFKKKRKTGKECFRAAVQMCKFPWVLTRW